MDYAPNKALKWLKAAAEQGLFSAKRDLALLLFELKKPAQQVTAALNSALIDDSEHPQLLLLKARIQAASNKPQHAKKLANSALKEANARNWDQSRIKQFMATLP